LNPSLLSTDAAKSWRPRTALLFAFLIAGMGRSPTESGHPKGRLGSGVVDQAGALSLARARTRGAQEITAAGDVNSRHEAPPAGQLGNTVQPYDCGATTLGRRREPRLARS
jgi:hypothetical protein